MSKRAKFLVARSARSALSARSAQLPANQKTELILKLFLWAVCGIAVPFLALAVSGFLWLLPPQFESRSVSSEFEQRAVSHVEVAAINSVAAEPIFSNVPNQTSLVQEQAEQNCQAVAQHVEQQLWPDFGPYNETYQGLTFFGCDDCVPIPLSIFLAIAIFTFPFAIFSLLQISKVQQSLRFIRRRIAFQLGLTSRGGSTAFRNRRKGQISYLTKHFFDQQLVHIALCLIMIAPVATIFCLSQPVQPLQSATIEQSQALPSWLNLRISQSKGRDYWADWQASPYGRASAAAQAAHVNWTRVFLHVAAILWAIFTEWRLMIPLMLMLLLFRSARQAKVSGERANIKQSLRQFSQYIVSAIPFLRYVSLAPILHLFSAGKPGVRPVTTAPILQISGKQQRFAEWKIKLKQRALH